MWYETLWNFLECEIFPLPSIETGRFGLFNAYRDVDSDLDLPEANLIRRANLSSFLGSLPAPPPLLLVGEAPGWRGCRFSGVPFTSEAQLLSGELPFKGQQSSKNLCLKDESTAKFFWNTLRLYHPAFFIWNSLPLHPYRSSDRCSNRPPTIYESRCFLPLLKEMYSILKPRKVVAIGRRAQWALAQTGIEAFPVRHPSHGGMLLFKNAISQIVQSY